MITPATYRGSLRLWTVQHESAWEQAEMASALRADGRRVYPCFRQAYRWMSGQMRRRLGHSKSAYPIWAWLRPKPDLRCSNHLEPGTPGVCVEFRIPGEHLLLSSLDAWTVVLNYGYLSLTEEEHDQWERRRKPGVSRHVNNGPEDVEKSWERIFDLEALDGSHWMGPVGSIQATLPEIPIEAVLGVRRFTAR